MRRSRILQVFVGATLLVGLLVASPWVDVRVSYRENVAQALDLFGSDDDEPEAEAAPVEPFWQEGGAGVPAAQPPGGAPLSFADLADRVKPAIVNGCRKAMSPALPVTSSIVAGSTSRSRSIKPSRSSPLGSASARMRAIA